MHGISICAGRQKKQHLISNTYEDKRIPKSLVFDNIHYCTNMKTSGQTGRGFALSYHKEECWKPITLKIDIVGLQDPQ